MFFHTWECGLHFGAHKIQNVSVAARLLVLELVARKRQHLEPLRMIFCVQLLQLLVIALRLASVRGYVHHQQRLHAGSLVPLRERHIVSFDISHIEIENTSLC